MSPSSYTIRHPTDNDLKQWNLLWQGYLIFYKSSLSDEVTILLWQRIHDDQHPINCFVAEDSSTGELIGLVHYIPHPSTWNAKQYCYLEDLFVSPSLRGGGVGEALIKAVSDEARNQNWSDVYWHTQENNTLARGLYDKITGGADGFICYRIEPDQ
jgi:ribosomal protein S18 acetylase RimI-like enzyme